MRRLTSFMLLIVSFIWGCADASAQRSLHIGAKLGLVTAGHWSPHEKPENTTVEPGNERGIAAGIALSYAPSQKVCLVVELLYFEKGAHHTVTTPDFPYGEMHLTYRCEYLDLPFMLRSYWFRLGGIRFYSYGGGYVGYMVSNTYRFLNEEKGVAERELDDTRRFDIGFVSGIGFDIEVQALSFRVEYRYAMGMLDLPLSTDPKHIPAFRGIDFPKIELRNLCHLLSVGTHISLHRGNDK